MTHRKRHLSEEHKRKIAESRIGDLNWSKRPEVRKKIGLKSLGRYYSEETRKKMSEIAKRNGNRPPTFNELSLDQQNKERKRRSGCRGGKTTLLGREVIAGRPRPEQCEVCGAFGKDFKRVGICFDHDHQTGKFRGWICSRCNRILGFARDNSELLVALSDYLKKSRENQDGHGICH